MPAMWSSSHTGRERQRGETPSATSHVGRKTATVRAFSASIRAFRAGFEQGSLKRGEVPWVRIIIGIGEDEAQAQARGFAILRSRVRDEIGVFAVAMWLLQLDARVTQLP